MAHTEKQIVEGIISNDAEVRAFLSSPANILRSGLIKIQNDSGEKVDFYPNPVQEYLLTMIERSNYAMWIVVLKSRQHGVSTFALALKMAILMSRLLEEGNAVNMMFLAQDGASARSLFKKKVRFGIDNLHKIFHKLFGIGEGGKTTPDNINRTSLSLTNDNTGSSASIETATSARSGTFQFLHISELSYSDRFDPIKAEEIVTGAIPTVPSDGLLISESTSRGSTGYFADSYKGSYKIDPTKQVAKKVKLMDVGYNGIFFSWRWDEKVKTVQIWDGEWESDLIRYFQSLERLKSPIILTPREKSFYRAKWLGLNGKMGLMRTEYPTTPEEALDSTNFMLFNSSSVKKMAQESAFFYKLRSYEVPVSLDDRDDLSFTVYESPEDPGKTGNYYYMGTDTSEGLGLDYSVVVIIKHIKSLDRYMVVAKFKDSKTNPFDLARVSIKMWSFFYKPRMCTERNGVGNSTVLKQLELLPDNNYMYTHEDLDKQGRDESVTGGASSIKHGFVTTKNSKPPMLDTLVSKVFNVKLYAPPGDEIYQSLKDCPDEFRVKSKVGKSKERTKLGHYDDIMALGLALFQATAPNLAPLIDNKEGGLHDSDALMQEALVASQNQFF